MTGKNNLKGFRAPRVDAHIKNEVNKDQTVRLNIDIDKAKLQKLKIYLYSLCKWIIQLMKL